MSSVERTWKEGSRKASQGARGVTGLHLTYVIYTLDTETHTPAAAESLCLFTLLPRPGTVLYILSMARPVVCKLGFRGAL